MRNFSFSVRQTLQRGFPCPVWSNFVWYVKQSPERNLRWGLIFFTSSVVMRFDREGWCLPPLRTRVLVQRTSCCLRTFLVPITSTTYSQQCARTTAYFELVRCLRTLASLRLRIRLRTLASCELASVEKKMSRNNLSTPFGFRVFLPLRKGYRAIYSFWLFS